MATDVLWGTVDEAPKRDSRLITLVRTRADALLEAAGCGERELSVVLTNDAEIAELAGVWLGKDGPTDVLSFPLDEPDPAPLGDVVISVETAARQARGRDWTTGDEVIFLLVHGVCHLLGHDHGEPEEAARMKAEEIRLLGAVAPELERPSTPY